MTTIEQRKTIAKIVLVVSISLLLVLLLIQFYPDIISHDGKIDTTSEAIDLGTANKNIIDRYDDYSSKITEFNENSNSLNDEINELKIYSDKTTLKYATGGGISIIVGLWISTIILYIKVGRDLFKE